MENKHINKIVIGIIIIVFTLFIFFIIKDSLREENNFTFNKSIVVQNATKYDVEKYTKIILEQILKIDSVEIMFLNSRLNFNIPGLEVQGYIIKAIEPNKYLIFITKDFKSENLKSLLSHELIHLQQMQEGRLIQLDSVNFLWEKTDTINFYNIEYKNRPSEIEAFEKQRGVEKELDCLLYE